MFSAIGFGPVGIWEMIFIVIVILLLFGAKKLPEVGSGLGKAIGNFKKTLKDGDDEASNSSDSSS